MIKSSVSIYEPSVYFLQKNPLFAHKINTRIQMMSGLMNLLTTEEKEVFIKKEMAIAIMEASEMGRLTLGLK